MRVTILVWTALVCLSLCSALAEVPQTISYQGVLKDSDGQLVADGEYTLTYRLYNAEDGGDSLWAEAITDSVNGGVFNAVLGKQTPLDLPFDQPYWLSIEVDGGGELSPRVEFTAAQYAFRGAVADSAGGSTATTAASPRRHRCPRCRPRRSAGGRSARRCSPACGRPR